MCFPDAFDQRVPRLTSGFLRLRERCEAVTWPNAGPEGFPSSRCCPACSLRQPFAGVSLVGGAFCLGTIGQGPSIYGMEGPCSACLTRLASFPARPALAADRRGQVPARSAGFPALPTSRSCPQVVPVSDARQGQTPARGASFPAPPTSPEFPPDGVRFRRPPGPNTRVRCQFPSPSHVPGVSSRWCPFPAVNEFLLLSRGAAQAPSENN